MARAINLKRMKHMNKRMILSSILDCPSSRAELAERLRLSRAAITALTEEMISEGLIYETNVYSAGVGRHPILLDVCRDRYYIGGVVLRRNELIRGFIDLSGRCVCTESCGIGADPTETLNGTADALTELARAHSIPEEKVLGVGVSAPGPLNTLHGILLNPPNFPGWQDVPVARILSQRLPWPVQMYNFTDTLALEERRYGAGQRFSSIMVLQVDLDGIGSGIIVRNQLFRSISEIGGMLGHMSICYNGKKCSCGNRGCLESYASIPAILAGTRFGSWEELTDAAAEDPEARRLVDREAAYIATAVTNCMNMISLDRVYITGRLSYRPAYLGEKINEIVNRRAIMHKYSADDRVEFSALRPSVRTGAISFLDAYLKEYN